MKYVVGTKLKHKIITGRNITGEIKAIIDDYYIILASDNKRPLAYDENQVKSYWNTVRWEAGKFYKHDSSKTGIVYLCVHTTTENGVLVWQRPVSGEWKVSSDNAHWTAEHHVEVSGWDA